MGADQPVVSRRSERYSDVDDQSGRWKVSQTVENWEPCADGTAVPGEQAFTFWPDPANKGQRMGRDQTIGPSGGCGKNRWLRITVPFRLTPVG
jgi:hypothetical protein